MLAATGNGVRVAVSVTGAGRIPLPLSLATYLTPTWPVKQESFHGIAAGREEEEEEEGSEMDVCAIERIAGACPSGVIAVGLTCCVACVQSHGSSCYFVATAC